MVQSTPSSNTHAASADQLELQLRQLSVQDNQSQLLQFINEHRDININAGSKSTGFTPLHWAIRKDLLNNVQVLLSSGASVDVTDKNNQTALDLANTMSKTKNAIEIKGLVNRYAEFKEAQAGVVAGTTSTSAGITAALRYPHLIQWFAKIYSQDKMAPSAPHILFVGPGVTNQYSPISTQGFSPQIFETLNVLPKATFDVIDIDKDVINSIVPQSYNSDALQIQYNQLKNHQNFEKSVPSQFWNNINACKASPEIFKPRATQVQDIRTASLGVSQYDLLITTNAIMYPAHENNDNNKSSDNIRLFSNLLDSVKSKGTLIIDLGSLKALFPNVNSTRDLISILQSTLPAQSNCAFIEPLGAQRTDAGYKISYPPNENNQLNRITTEILVAITKG